MTSRNSPVRSPNAKRPPRSTERPPGPAGRPIPATAGPGTGIVGPARFGEGRDPDMSLRGLGGKSPSSPEGQRESVPQPLSGLRPKAARLSSAMSGPRPPQRHHRRFPPTAASLRRSPSSWPTRSRSPSSSDPPSKQFGGMDLLFNIGADMTVLRGDTNVVDIDLAVWERTMTVSPRGHLLTMQHTIPISSSAAAARSSACRRSQRSRANRHGRHLRADPPCCLTMGSRRHPLQRNRSRIHRDRLDPICTPVARATGSRA